MFLSDILTRWIYSNVFTADELADAAERNVKTIYGYASGNDMPFSVARRLARYAQLRGHHDIQESLMTAEYEICRRGMGMANGSVDDEIGRMAEALADARRSHADGCAASMNKAIAAAETTLRDLKAERDRLNSRS